MNHKLLLAVAAVGLLLGVLGVWVGAQSTGREETVVRFERESRYYLIRVVDYPKQGRRCLHFSKSRGIQSSMILTDPEKLDLAYSQSMIAALALHPEPKEVLLVGLGGGAIPKFIQKQFPAIRIDIVEIDPDVVTTCQEWFQFKGTPNTRVYVIDGRLYMKRAKAQYDVILLDAYAADRIPFHMTTLEFVQLVKGRLKPGGVVASNLWEHVVNRFYYAELRTFQQTFPQTYLFKSGDSGNVIVFGALDEKQVPKDTWVKRAESLVAGRTMGFDLPALVQKEYEYLTPRRISEKPLTDDMAPVDTLRHENPRYFDQESKAPGGAAEP